MLSFLEKHKIYLVYSPLFIYWIILFIATSLPTVSIPSFDISDKVQHWGAYLVLTVLFNLTISFQNKSELLKKYHYIFTVIIVTIYAAFDEIHQYFIPGRSCELLDFFADVLGLISGLFIIFILRVMDSRERKPGTGL
ncbi:MAG TPA: VanZ family protein [Ignavibacteriaceae bacterium]|nr:VanZ family protein [Ignavibacteriaceae bacterium]